MCSSTHFKIVLISGFLHVFCLFWQQVETAAALILTAGVFVCFAITGLHEKKRYFFGILRNSASEIDKTLMVYFLMVDK